MLQKEDPVHAVEKNSDTLDTSDICSSQRSSQENSSHANSADGDDTDEDCDEKSIWDPLEDWNRAVWLFNQLIDNILITPLLLFYSGLIPPFLQERIHCVLSNLSAITSTINSLLQCDPEKFSIHFGGFLLNTTVGICGLFNVAHSVGLTLPSEDFGKTLRVCGNVSPGCYVIFPFLGPTNLRDMVGKVADFFISPLGFIAQNIDTLSFFSTVQYTIGKNIFDYMSVRLMYKDILDPIQETFSDPYIILRHSYYVVRGDVVESSFEEFLEEELLDDESLDDEFLNEEVMELEKKEKLLEKKTNNDKKTTKE